MTDVMLQHPAGDLPVGLPRWASQWRDEGPDVHWQRLFSGSSINSTLDPLPTTLVMQSLPRCYNRDMLVRLFNNYGFEGKYDFVFLPLDEAGQENLGHAIVNLTGPLVAALFCDTFQGFKRWWHSWMTESCEVSWSPVAQGLEANIAVYGECGAFGDRVSDEHDPAIFEDVREASLPSLDPRYAIVPEPVQPPTPAAVDRTEAEHAAPAWTQAPAEPQEPQEHTTVMMRNVPRCYTRDMLERLINNHGFGDKVDFLFLPRDFATGDNQGYAYVNFVDMLDGARFQDTFHGFSRWWFSWCNEVCEVGRSQFEQGLQENIRRYRNSPVMHESVPDGFRPVIFANGVRQPFPPPTKKLRPPRTKRQRHLRGGLDCEGPDPSL